MTLNGVVLGGPYHGQTLASEHNVLRVAHFDETLMPTTHRDGLYVHKTFRTTSGDEVGVWDWQGWSS